LTLWLVNFVAASQFLIIAPVLPRILEALDMPESYGGSLVSIYAAMVAVFALIAGPISDRFGRVAVLRAGSMSMTLALLAHGLVWDYPSMLAVRGLAGMASGVMAGAAAAYIGDIYPYERRGAAMGVIFSAMAFGQIIGIPAGTVLAGLGGFWLPFVVFAGFMVVGSLLTWTSLPHPDVAHAGKFGLGIVVRDYRDLVARVDISSVNAASLFMMFSVGAFIVYMPTWLEQAHGASAWDVALMFLLGGVAQGAASPLVGRLSDRIGRKGLIVSGSFGVGVFFFATPFVPRLWMFWVFFPVVMILVAARITPLQALMSALTGPEHRGSLMSLNMCFSQLGFGLGSAVAGVAWTYGFAVNAAVAGVTALLAASIVHFLVPEPDALATQETGRA